VQYFSQQAVARLLPAAGIELPGGMPLAVKLAEVQKLMAAGDERARRLARLDHRRHIMANRKSCSSFYFGASLSLLAGFLFLIWVK
jgi:hypothetical protein